MCAMTQRAFTRLKTTCRWAAVACLVALALIFVYVGQLLGRSLPTLIVTSLSSVWLLSLAGLAAFYGRLSRRVRRGTSLALACTLVLLALGWSNLYRIETYLNYRDWLAYESKHFVFHCAPGSSLRDDMESYASVRDTAFEQVCGALKVDFPGKIDFYVYDFLGMGWAVPEERQVFADKGQTIGHEMTHVISYYIARRPQKIVLLNEGLATYFNQKPVDHHQVAWEHMQKNTLPPLTALADRKAFRRSNPYYQAASFVGYLI
ncbi:MAG TPA: hypothetical protein PLG21_21920, partial [Anaerolineae bacterium]|nr:hypothetical protein [Anaerolineae bacterium]